MTRVTASKARDELAEILNRVRYRIERVILERRGKEVAAMISIEDLKLFEKLLREEEDRIDAEAAEAAKAEGGSNVSWDDLKKESGL